MEDEKIFEDMKNIKMLIDKWNKEIISVLNTGNNVVIRKNKDKIVLYKQILNKMG